MTTFYVINAVRGEVIEVLASDINAAHHEAYVTHPEWRGDWMTCTRTPPTQEEIQDLMGWLPENE